VRVLGAVSSQPQGGQFRRRSRHREVGIWLKKRANFGAMYLALLANGPLCDTGVFLATFVGTSCARFRAPLAYPGIAMTR